MKAVASLSELRARYPQFLYRDFSWELKDGTLAISFDFAIPPDIRFSPKVVIKNVPRDALKRVGEKTLSNLVFHLGLMEMPSYWKTVASPVISVEAGALDKNQIAWWKDLFIKGMGQFFFENEVDFTKKNFLKITSSGSVLSQAKDSLAWLRQKERVLVPIGGGKDAAVTLELLKKNGMEIRPFILNPKREQLEVVRVFKKGEKPVIVERTIDPKLLELNKKGYLNGHTPFSAYLAFLTVMAAVLFNYKYVALSNERSSEEGNVEYMGKEVNHQYSKTFAFEKSFQEYNKKYLAPEIEYFSFLRPLYEIQISRMFAQYPKYFSVFLSCNIAAKKGTSWCGSCPKCLSVYLLLAPFLPKEKLLKIFSKNMLQDESLQPLLERLTGKRGFKPFECVGAIQEHQAALAMLQKPDTIPAILSSWNPNHALPPSFTKALKRAAHA